VEYDGVEVCPFVETGIPVPSSGGHHAIPRVYTAGNQDRHQVCYEIPNFFGFSGPVIEDFRDIIVAKLADCQVPVHGEDAEIPKAKYKCPQCLIN
jgi:hypothetical protein